MSTDHRKPVVAFAMLALAATLVIGLHRAEAQGGGRLLAAAAGVGAHVQGTVVSPSESLSSRGYDRIADLGPAFVSVREAVGHTNAPTVTSVAPSGRVGKPSAPGGAVVPAGDRRGLDGPADQAAGSGTSGSVGQTGGPAGSAPATGTTTAGTSRSPKGGAAVRPGTTTAGPVVQPDAAVKPGKAGEKGGVAGRTAKAGTAAKAGKAATAKAGTAATAKAGTAAKAKAGTAAKAGKAGKSGSAAKAPKPGKATRPATAYRSGPTSRRPRARTHPDVRPTARAARVGATPRATGVPALRGGRAPR